MNKDCYYQLVTEHVGTLQEESSAIPPVEPRLGIERVKLNGINYLYGYSWLRMADWALIVQGVDTYRSTLFPGVNINIVLVSLGVIISFF